MTWMTWPPPIASPFTAAMTGFGMSRMTRCRASISKMPLRGGPVVAGLGPLLHVAAGAERLVAGTGQDDGADAVDRPMPV